MTSILAIHIAATVAMVGIIWSVQWVQYPLFAQVEGAQFRGYHDAHMRRIGNVVGPLMILEAGTGVLLVANSALISNLGFLVSLVLLAVIWGSTFVVQIPLHRRLGATFSKDDVQRLVRSNWLRTIPWTARALLLFTTLPAGAIL